VGRANLDGQVGFHAADIHPRATTLQSVKGWERPMPRRLRIHAPGGFYHVTLRGNHQQNIFHADADRCLLNAIVGRSTIKYDSRIHAYCWMSNHLHFLVQVGVEPLSSLMRQIASGYARAFQSKFETTGHLFERRYHATLVDEQSYFLQLLRYIHLNPVRAGLVHRPDQYRWSSHRAYAGGGSEDWLTTDFALAIFSTERRAAQAAYCAFLQQSESQESIERFSTGHSAILGDDTFVQRISRGLATEPVARQSLESLIDEGCEQFGVSHSLLLSASRDPAVVQARAWVANQAKSRGIATLSAVARRLGRDRATLRYAMRQRPRTGA
jgi:putative transposase